MLVMSVASLVTDADQLSARLAGVVVAESTGSCPVISECDGEWFRTI
jgi:formyltetrahydrofolate synthetase